MRPAIISVLALFFCINADASPDLKSKLSSTWKAQQFAHPTLDKNDILMGYGGDDVQHKTILAGQDISA